MKFQIIDYFLKNQKLPYKTFDYLNMKIKKILQYLKIKMLRIIKMSFNMKTLKITIFL